MPIYNDSRGAVVVHLGRGDVVIAPAGDPHGEEHQDELVFGQVAEPHPIGEYDENKETYTTEVWGDRCVRVVIGDIASLDVLIERAQTLRERMAANAAHL